MRMRWRAYAGVSVTLAAGVVLKALHQRPNFYSAAVYVAQSSVNLMIMTNLVFLTACSLMLGLQKLLYGPLRPIEIEQLYEKAWFAVTETCLAMTIFRGEVGAWFLVMLFSLLAGKVWGWIGEGRVEILEQQPPANPRLFHTRLALSLAISVLFDSYMLEYCIKKVLHQARPDMTVMFGFEFAILTILSTSTAARYAINLTEIYIIRKQKAKRIEEIRRERRAAAQANADETSVATQDEVEARTMEAANTTVEEVDDAEIEVEGWEDKGRWVFYLDIATDFLKLVVYLSFFFILLVFYALPLHIMRDVFLTLRSFYKRLTDFVKYRKATRDMHERYPDASAEEVGREDVCIICREEMRTLPQPAAGQRQTNPAVERMRPKKLPCGHILHFSCLRSWLERQQICPTCRRPVLAPERNQANIPGNNAQLNALRQQGLGALRQQGAHPPNNQAAENRARILQFGPFRFGFGAGRGDMLQDLAQRVQNGENRPVAAVNQNVRHFGIGFGIGRQPAAPPSRPQTTDIPTQLQQAEQQIQREIDQLRLTLNELNVVRMLSGELARLRSLREDPGALPTDGSATSTFARPTPTSTVTALVPNPQQNILQAGDAALPEGLTLPQGWSMMPLRRVDAPQTMMQPIATQNASTAVGPTPPPPMNGTPVNILREPPPRQMSSTAQPQAPTPMNGLRNGGEGNGRPSAADPAINGLLFGHGVHLPSPSPHPGSAPVGRNLQAPNSNEESAPNISHRMTAVPREDASNTSSTLPSWGSNAPTAQSEPRVPNGHDDELAGSKSEGGHEQFATKEAASSRTEPDGSGADKGLDTTTAASSSNGKGKAKAVMVEDLDEHADH